MGKLGRYDYFKHDKPTDKFITNFTSQDNQGITKQMLATVGFGINNSKIKLVNMITFQDNTFEIVDLKYVANRELVAMIYDNVEYGAYLADELTKYILNGKIEITRTGVLKFAGNENDLNYSFGILIESIANDFDDYLNSEEYRNKKTQEHAILTSVDIINSEYKKDMLEFVNNFNLEDNEQTREEKIAEEIVTTENVIDVGLRLFDPELAEQITKDGTANLEAVKNFISNWNKRTKPQIPEKYKGEHIFEVITGDTTADNLSIMAEIMTNETIGDSVIEDAVNYSHSLSKYNNTEKIVYNLKPLVSKEGRDNLKKDLKVKQGIHKGIEVLKNVGEIAIHRDDVDNPHVKINTKTLNVDVDVFKEFGKSIEGKLDDDTKSVDLDNTVAIKGKFKERKNWKLPARNHTPFNKKIVEISQEQRDNTFKEVLLNISGEYKEFQNYSNFCTNTTKIYSNDYWFSNSTMIGESFKLGE